MLNSSLLFRSGRLRQPRPRTITIVPSKISRPTAAAVLPMAVPRSVRNPQRSQRKRAKRRIPMMMMMMRANRRDWSSGPSHININIYKNKKITKTNKKPTTTTSSVDLSLSQSIAFCSKLYPNVPHHLQHQHTNTCQTTHQYTNAAIIHKTKQNKMIWKVKQKPFYRRRRKYKEHSQIYENEAAIARWK